jgi:hypothetical protein
MCSWKYNELKKIFAIKLQEKITIDSQ